MSQRYVAVGLDNGPSEGKTQLLGSRLAGARTSHFLPTGSGSQRPLALKEGYL